jgi:hypothetical protein
MGGRADLGSGGRLLTMASTSTIEVDYAGTLTTQND